MSRAVSSQKTEHLWIRKLLPNTYVQSRNQIAVFINNDISGYEIELNCSLHITSDRNCSNFKFPLDSLRRRCDRNERKLVAKLKIHLFK